MKNVTIEYYFSKNALVLGTILIIVITPTLSYLSYTTYFEPSPYNEKKFVAIIMLALLVLFLAAIARRYVTMLISIIKNRPALILTNETLIDNQNRKSIKWSDIKEITYKHHNAGKASQYYITLSLKDSDEEIKIAEKGIKCKWEELLHTLTEYHDKYK